MSGVKCDSFPSLLHRFFQHLRSAQEVSPHTICAYRDTFRLFLKFIAEDRRITVDQISLEDICPDVVLDFLGHLQNQRRNCTRTRNARLAAIRAFVRFALGQVAPDFLGPAQRILSIPCKRTDRPMLGFLSRKEVEAVLAAPDLSTLAGRRDHLLFSLLYNTGARISEVLKLTPGDFHHQIVRLHGKGRKEREVPLWRHTYRTVLRWCQDNGIIDAQPVFSNPRGEPLSRRAAARRFALTMNEAAMSCPTLAERKVTLHTLRHTTAMHLLQAGVPVEVIALWLGHEQLSTTHGYLEADLKMKQQILGCLRSPTPWRRALKPSSSHILAFLDAL